MKRWFGLQRDCSLGSMKRRGWRLAWYQPLHHTGVYLPIPFHWVARCMREVAYRFRLACSAPRLEAREYLDATRTFHERERMAEEFARGYLCGWRECFDACKDAIDAGAMSSNWN